MSELIISLLNYRYPFGQAPTGNLETKVEQIQPFSDSKDLREKKTQMLKKNDVITNPYIIKLLTVYQENLHLHYVYEYIPYTLTSYILMKYNTEKKEVWEMTRKLFIKKMTYELTILISYLAKMKIQLELKLSNLGMTENEKLKVYMSSKCRMGLKPELTLINLYGQSKDKILKQLNKYVQSLQKEDSNPPNFKIDGNRLVFDQQARSASYLNSQTAQKIEDSVKGSLPSAKLPKSVFNSNNFTKRKLSFQDFKFGATSQPKFRYHHPRFQADRSRQHKYSYQCNHNQSPSKSYIAHADYNRDDDQDIPDTTFSHSKKIKIQLEQKQNGKGQKERKNSIKVKITSFRQYEVNNCDAEKLFNPEGVKDEDIFQYFSKKAQNQQDEHQEEEEEVKSNACHKERKTTSETQNTFTCPNAQPFPKRRPQSTPSSEHLEQFYSVKEFEQKVRAAKERAAKVLSRMKVLKKAI